MNPKQMVFEAFDLGDPPEVPACLFGGGMFALYNSGTDFRSLMDDPVRMAQVNIDIQKMTGMPIVYVGSGYNNFYAAALGGKIKFREIGAPDLEKPLITTADDLGRLNIDDLARDTLVQTVWEATRRTAEAIGDEAIVTATAWGPLTLASQIFGVEQTMRAIYKRPDEVHRVVDFATEVILAFYEPLIADGTIEMVSLADPTASGDLVSRQHFREFALPPIQKLADSFHQRGVRSLLHVCGNTTDKLDLLVATRCDCVSIDAKVDIGTAKEAFAGKCCLAGNVAPVRILLQGTPEEVEEECNKVLDAAAPGGGFVLMPGCDISPTVPLENVKVFMETARTWKARSAVD